MISTQVAAAAFMAFLFVVELWAFLGSTVQTGVILDANTDTLLRINFNVQVGGTFTTVGLIDAVAHKVLKAGKQL